MTNARQGNSVRVHYNGEPIRVTITGISESTVTLDANHPMAGKDLTFEIQLMEIS